MQHADPRLYRVLFEEGGESVWAIEVADGLYCIDNIPFITNLVSYKDVVVAEQVDDAAPGFMRFVRVHSRGGHSTFRVEVNPGQEAAQAADQLLQFFKDGGCRTERWGGGIVAIDVPPLAVDQSDIFWLVLGHAVDQDVWSYDVGYTETQPPWERKSAPRMPSP